MMEEYVLVVCTLYLCMYLVGGTAAVHTTSKKQKYAILNTHRVSFMVSVHEAEEMVCFFLRNVPLLWLWLENGQICISNVKFYLTTTKD